MKPFFFLLFIAMFLTVLSPAPLPAQDRFPTIGYIYPAGGRQGDTVQLMIGGQYLWGVSSAHFIGQEITVLDVEHVRPLDIRHLSKLRRRIRELRARLAAEAAGETAPPESGDSQPMQDDVVLPNHPLIRDLDEMTGEELAAVHDFFLDPRRRQQINRSIQDIAVVEIEIPEGSSAGDIELRLRTPLGLTNPMVFQIGKAPEIMEKEPNDLEVSSLPALEVPVTINGRIMQGDVDRFLFRAAEGQRLVISVRARQLVPYIADAVPGWFEAVLALYDPDGREVACSGGFRSCPDPVIFYKVPRDGEYTVEIRDAIYRGREDFVYRISIDESPFIKHIFPAGGRAGSRAYAMVSGWNLPETGLLLDTQPGPEKIRETTLESGGLYSNRVKYAVCDLPESFEAEPNNTPRDACPVSIPVIVNGRVGIPGDVDVFRFSAEAGDEVTAEVYARRLGSPLDSFLKLTDSSGNILAWNDDNPDKGSGLDTHHADSYIRCKIPEDGDYFLHLSDAQGQGGKEFVYRLRITPPIPDFELRVVPASITAPAGTAVPLAVHAIRRDGFAGDIRIELEKPSQGFNLEGGLIPEGRDSVRMTITAPTGESAEPVELKFTGRASINGRETVRRAVPADDMMQAFGNRHLVPARKTMAVVTSARRRPRVMEIEKPGTVEIPAGGERRVKFINRVPGRIAPAHLALSDAPGGIFMEDIEIGHGFVEFTLKANADKIKPGYAGNLIVDIFTERQERLRFAGVLPAIPFRVTRQ